MQDAIDYAFLHGGGQGSWVWEETIAALRKIGGSNVDNNVHSNVGKVLALDVPGCGSKRQRATEGLDNNDIARELVDDIERAQLRNVVLVGHSQGGQVVPLMAALQPSLFRRLIYLSCTIPPLGKTTLQQMGHSKRGTRDDEVGYPFDPARDEGVDRYTLMFCNDMSDTQRAEFLAKLGRDQWPADSYTFNAWPYDTFGVTPSSYVICLRDNILPVPWQERFAERYKVERQIPIDAGHQAMNTRPDELAKILLDEARR